MDSRLYEEIGKAVEYAKEHGGTLTEQNLKYVVTVALDVESKTGVDFEYLFPEGVIEMAKKEQTYDPEKNNSFTGYCGSSVRAVMLNYVNRKSDLVHIPANHKKGFKKGQETREEASTITYEKIDANNYDTLGTSDSYAFNYDRWEILMNGLATLDETARKIMKMKLRIGEYENLEKNNMKVIAEELDLTPQVAKRIYDEAFEKLSAYCQFEDRNTL